MSPISHNRSRHVSPVSPPRMLPQAQPTAPEGTRPDIDYFLPDDSSEAVTDPVTEVTETTTRDDTSSDEDDETPELTVRLPAAKSASPNVLPASRAAALSRMSEDVPSPLSRTIRNSAIAGLRRRTQSSELQQRSVGPAPSPRIAPSPSGAAALPAPKETMRQPLTSMDARDTARLGSAPVSATVGLAQLGGRTAPTTQQKQQQHRTPQQQQLPPRAVITPSAFMSAGSMRTQSPAVPPLKQTPLAPGLTRPVRSPRRSEPSPTPQRLPFESTVFAVHSAPKVRAAPDAAAATGDRRRSTSVLMDVLSDRSDDDM